MRRPESKDQLVKYLKKNLSKDYTEESLKFALVSQGYSKVAVDKAAEQAHKEISQKAPILREKPVIKYELYDDKNKLVDVGPFSFWEKIKNIFGRTKY